MFYVLRCVLCRASYVCGPRMAVHGDDVAASDEYLYFSNIVLMAGPLSISTFLWETGVLPLFLRSGFVSLGGAVGCLEPRFSRTRVRTAALFSPFRQQRWMEHFPRELSA